MIPIAEKFSVWALWLWRTWIADLRDAWAALIGALLPRARRQVRLCLDGDSWEATLLGARSPPEPLRIDWAQADDAAQRLSTWVESNGLRGTRVVAVLPPSRVLRRVWTAPAALEHALERAVLLQVPRLFPVASAQLAASHRVVERAEDGLTVTVEIAATRQSLLAMVAERLTRAGLALSYAETAGDSMTPPHRFVRNDEGVRSPADRGWTVLERAMAISAAGLVMGLLVVWTVQSARERNAWATALAAADAASIPAERSSRQLLSLLTPAQSLLREATQPTAGAALSALTSQVPGDSWVSHWEWRPEATTVHVFTSNAAALTALLDASELTARVQLQSATPAPGLPGIEQAKYQLAIEVEP